MPGRVLPLDRRRRHAQPDPVRRLLHGAPPGACGEFFATTGYGFNGGTALANVNARYVEFGRGRDNQCYLVWRDAVPAT